MRRRDVIVVVGAAAVPLTGCSRSAGGRDGADVPADGGGRQSGSSADGRVVLTLAGGGGALDAFEECTLRIDRWAAREDDGTRWPSGPLSTAVDLAAGSDDASTTLEAVWVDIGDPHRFEAVEVSIGEVTATMSSGDQADVAVASPEEFPIGFRLDAVETVAVELDLAPVRVDGTDRFDLELVDRTVGSTPSI